MTAASTTLSGYAYGNGTYVASAPEQSSSSNFQVWYAFDNSITSTTESAGVYSTSSPFAYSNTSPYAFSNTIDSVTTTRYNGVWHQLQMPSAIVLEYYTIFPRSGNETTRSPATWRVFGSNNGTDWVTIDAQSSVTSWSAPQVSKTYYLNPLPVAYSYFRLSVQNVNGSSGGILDVAQWNLYGKPPVPAMSILGGDLSIASGGGLNIGPGTLGSNVVIFSNISGGSNVVVMDSNGRVGIGAMNPSATLQVSGNVYASNALQTTNVFASTVNTTNPIPFRNRIINGAMTLWQRNTATITTTASLYTTADRWCGALGTSGLLLSVWPGPIEAPQFSNAIQVTTSNVSTGVPLIEQRIENANIPDFLNGTPVSVSFWVGQSYGTLMPLTVGLYYATAVNNFGTQTLAVAATQNTPTLTVANAYYSLSFTLNTSLGATNGLSLRFTTGGASAIGSGFFLTGVQVEKGAFATPFEVRPCTTELALAQRYYYQLTSPSAAVQGSSAVYAIFGTATGITTTAFWLPIQFPVPMRTPNYAVSNSVVTSFQLLPTGTTTITNVGVQSDSYTTTGATLNFVGTNIVPTASYIFRTNNLTGSNVAFFGFSCEL